MPDYIITAPDGQKYRVSGQGSAEEALAHIQQMQPSAQPQQADPRDNAKGKFDATVGGFVNTATFGLGDEIAGFAGGVADLAQGGEYLKGYRRTRDNARARDKADEENRPGYRLGGQLLGGVATGVAAAPLTVSARLGQGASLLGRVGAGLADGAIAGAAYGAGSGETAGERAQGALRDGGIGAVAGGIFPVIASGVSGGYQAARRAMAGNQAARRAGSTPEALRMLGNVMDADGTRGPRGAQNMARAGQEAMLADAGPNARAVLDTSIQRGGPGALQARDAITQRVARDSARFTQVLDDTLGIPEGVTAARTAIRQGSAQARNSTYTAAYNTPIDYSLPAARNMENMIRNRVPADAINAANRLMRTRGEASQQIMAQIADDGSVIFETLPDVRQIDYITRGLNQLAETGDGAGALGGQTAMGSAYQSLARDIRRDLRRLVPNYGLALDTAADPIERSQAVRFGSRLLSRAVARDEVAEAVQGMSRAERTAAAQGIRSNIDDQMANVTRAIQDGNMDAREAIKGLKELSSRANREKVATVIGQRDATRLFAEVDRITASFELRASVAENSKTFARLATDESIKETTAPGPVGLLAQGQALNAPKRALQSITGQTPADVRRQQDAIYSELSRLLTQPPGQARRAFRAIDTLGQTDALTARRAGQIAASLRGPHLSYPSVPLVEERRRGR